MSTSQAEDRPLAKDAGGTDGGFTRHTEAVWAAGETYVPRGFKGLFANSYVTACAAFSTLGGLLFGYE